MRALIIVVVLAIVGAGVWYFATGDEKLRLGFAGDKPLGDAEKVEKHLTGIGLKRFEFDPIEAHHFFDKRFEGAKDVTFAEYDDTAVPSLKHRVIVVKGTDGRLLGIGGRFRSGSYIYSTTGTKCEHFISLLWKQVNGGLPKWEKLQEGGADARDYWLATVKKPGYTCAWRKEGGGGVVTLTQEIHDTVGFWVP